MLRNFLSLCRLCLPEATALSCRPDGFAGELSEDDVCGDFSIKVHNGICFGVFDGAVLGRLLVVENGLVSLSEAAFDFLGFTKL